ncbi:hypothetical protein Bca4012_033791 [Brassica carinata]|uniref:Knottin scorpion toxin-like domain-containing protein n=1 Tax=Brassica oleracea TaxID=3712 RepID=A0A3P6C8E9_BRAOL|nr:unnamed protein product [Brassica oleracea]
MRKSLQLLFTFLTIFIVLSLGMMADAQKNEAKECPYKLPIDKTKRCGPLNCLNLCKKKYGPTGSGSCSEEKGFCNCTAHCKGSP